MYMTDRGRDSWTIKTSKRDIPIWKIKLKIIAIIMAKNHQKAAPLLLYFFALFIPFVARCVVIITQIKIVNKSERAKTICIASSEFFETKQKYHIFFTIKIACLPIEKLLQTITFSTLSILLYHSVHKNFFNEFQSILMDFSQCWML